MLIRPGVGSFSFLGEILLDIEVELPPPKNPADPPKKTTIKSRCGDCRRCLDQCPTQAFAKPMILDARKCISYLTIEKRGAFNSWEQQAIGSWLFGCDICQEVCPHNHSGISISKCSEFRPEMGVGPYLSLSELLSLRTDEEFYRRFAGTPLTRAKREGLLRNACAVAANTGCHELLPALAQVVDFDKSEMLVGQARQAISRLSSSS